MITDIRILLSCVRKADALTAHHKPDEAQMCQASRPMLGALSLLLRNLGPHLSGHAGIQMAVASSARPCCQKTTMGIDAWTSHAAVSFARPLAEAGRCLLQLPFAPHVR